MECISAKTIKSIQFIYISQDPRVCEVLVPITPENVEGEPDIVYCSQEYLEVHDMEERVVMMIQESTDELRNTAKNWKGRRGGKGGRGNGQNDLLVKFVLPVVLSIVIVLLLVCICILRSKLKKAATFNQRMAEAEKGVQIEDVSI